MTDLSVTALQDPRAAHYRQAARAVARTVVLVLGLLAKANRARRDTKYLMSLNDYLLKDIGITRGEIEAVVRRG
jgi:uncharacterized protein YjiS (DUF1127 family)